MTLRDSIKANPLAAPLVERWRDLRAALTDWNRRRVSENYCGDIFEDFYVNKRWMVDGDSVSGDGSTLSSTIEIRRRLPLLANQLNIKSLVDAPCGDFLWMREIVGCFEKYVGIDIVPKLVASNNQQFANNRIGFLVADITKDPLPAGDAVLCRDCFIHLSTALIWEALRNFRKAGFRYIMLTQNDPVTEYREIVTGGCRAINWRLPPFSFPRPVDSIVENTGNGRLIAIWEASTLLI